MSEIDKKLEKADKLANSTSWFNKDEDREKGMILYKEIYTSYFIKKDYLLAAQIALKAAILSEKMDNGFDVKHYYKKSAVAYKKANNIEKCIEIYNLLIEKLEKNTDYWTLAKTLEELAVIFEEKSDKTNKEDEDKAIDMYLRSINYYESDDKSQSCIKLLKKIAEIYLNRKEIEKAKETYSKLIDLYDKSTNSKFMLSEYVYMLALCEFNLYAKENDYKLDTLIRSKEEAYPFVINSREFTLLRNCIGAFKDNNKEKFEDEIRNYDFLKKLDRKHIVLYGQIKEIMVNGGPNGPNESEEDLL